MRKFTILLVTAFMAFTITGWGQIISQYIEANSGSVPKGIEIWNNTAGVLDFSTNSLVIEKGTNGGAPSADYTLSAGTLAVGAVIVIGTSDMETTTVANGSAFYTKAFTFNGDDALVVKYGGVTTDVLGTPGSDPGSAWTGSGVSTANQNIELKGGITTGDLVGWTDPSLRFQIVNTDPSGVNGDEGFGIAPSGGSNTPPTITNIQGPVSVTSSTTVSISADVTDTDGTVTGVELHWGTASGVLGTTIAMSNVGGDTYTTDTDIPAQANGTTVYYEIEATDDDSDVSTSSEQNYDVNDAATTTLPYSQTFDADLGDCYNYSVAGPSNNWIWDDMGGPNGHAYMNGYGGANPEEDWLIVPGIDFDSYTNEIMQFYTFYEYGNEDANNYLKLFYSPDYAGVGDPTGATWTELSFIQASAWAAWQPSYIVDLSGISGTNVYIGFKYYSTDAPRSWRVDDISIFEGSQVNVTFQVNMADQTVTGDGVHLVGSFDEWWDPAANSMSNGGAGDIYTVTKLLYSNIEYQFKYVNGNTWGADEGVPIECQAPGTTNRFEVVGGADYSIPTVCFGSCVDCGVLYDYDVTFRVDMKNETVGVEGVNIAGINNNWGNTPMTNVSGTIWEITISLQESSYHEFKFKNGDGGWENFDGPCLASSWGNRYLTVPSEATTLDLVCFNSCDVCPVADFVMINEVDADTPGNDDAEFIELYDGGVGNTDLSGLVVVLYNGSDDQSYLPAIDLDGYSTNAQGYFVIGSTGMGTDIELSPGGSGWLQNGADAVALHIGNDTDYPNDTPVSDVNLIDAIVYDTDDGYDAGLIDVLTPGQPQINENGRGDKDNQSNQRIPNGSGGLRMTMTYDQSPTTTGVANVGIYTDWTGAIDGDWDNAGNWHNGVPTGLLNVEIPDVNAKASFPVISGSATAASLYMAVGSTLEIAGTGDLTVNGTFVNNGTLNIKSDASGTGSLIETSGVSANIDRYLTPNTWHYVSSPVASLTSDMFEALYLMEWDEPTETWSFIEDLGVTLNPTMYGYAVWADATSTVAFSSTTNVGPKSIGVTNNNIDPGVGNSGFNFVGNPYASGVDWDVDDGSGWTRTNVANSVYIWNGTAGNYGVYVKGNGGSGSLGVTNEIPPHQGFFVYCDDDAGPGAGSGTLAVDNDARIHTSQEILKGGKTYSDNLTLAVTGNNYNDEIIIGINSESSENFDSQFDALKFNGSEEAPQLYSISNDEKRLSINSIPEITANMTIPVGFKAGVEAIYEISLSDLNGFDETPLYLEDLIENVVVDIKSDIYVFSGSPEDITDRFLLHFFNPAITGTIDTPSSDNIFVFASNSTIKIISNEQFSGDVTVFDIIGQEVLSTKLSNTSDHEISMTDKSGYFIVNIVSDRGVVNKKIYLNK